MRELPIIPGFIPRPPIPAIMRLFVRTVNKNTGMSRN